MARVLFQFLYCLLPSFWGLPLFPGCKGARNFLEDGGRWGSILGCALLLTLLISATHETLLLDDSLVEFLFFLFQLFFN